MAPSPELPITEKELQYLNGFLEAVAGYNSFTNDSKSYYAALLSKAAADDIQETLRTHFGVKHWLITTSPATEEWQQVLAEELRPYFGQIITEVGHLLAPDSPAETLANLRKNEELPIGLVMQSFLINLAEVVPQQAVLNRVKVDWQQIGVVREGFYECYENDYLFDMPGYVLFLHFGGSD